MSNVKIKPEYAERVFGFNNSSAPLGMRDDIVLLYNDAKAHNIGFILEMFEEVKPDEAEKETAKVFTDKQQAKIAKSNQAGRKEANG